MKTIAITIDEEMLTLIDELTASDRYASRSALVREALAAYIAGERRLAEEERERALIRKHRRPLNEQLQALVDEQARP